MKAADTQTGVCFKLFANARMKFSFRNRQPDCNTDASDTSFSGRESVEEGLAPTHPFYKKKPFLQSNLANLTPSSCNP